MIRLRLATSDGFQEITPEIGKDLSQSTRQE